MRRNALSLRQQQVVEVEEDFDKRWEEESASLVAKKDVIYN